MYLDDVKYINYKQKDSKVISNSMKELEMLVALL